MWEFDMGPGICCGRKSIGEVWAWANSVLAETQLDLVCLERTIKIFYFKFYSLVCKGQINLQSGKKGRNYCFPIEIPLMYSILYTSVHEEVQQQSKNTQQGKW